MLSRKSNQTILYIVHCQLEWGNGKWNSHKITLSNSIWILSEIFELVFFILLQYNLLFSLFWLILYHTRFRSNPFQGQFLIVVFVEWLMLFAACVLFGLGDYVSLILIAASLINSEKKFFSLSLSVSLGDWFNKYWCM